MRVKIYQPSKTAMQSGRGNTRQWVLEFEPGPRRPEPLMGWTSSADTRAQVRLRFDSKEDAIAHARNNGWMFTVLEPRPSKIRPKAYADNFAYERYRPWTH
jgi:hypothetical protein